MWFKKPFTLVRRKNTSGRYIYYYRVWDPETGKLREFSTGQKSRQAAEHFCEKLREAGRLVPTPSQPCPNLTAPSPLRGGQTFQVFAQGWWEGTDCPYYQYRLKKGKVLSRGYRELCGSYLKRYILPTFGDAILERIIAQDIEIWHSSIPGGPRIKNTALATLRVMLGEAVRLGLILSNPCYRVSPVQEPTKVREIYKRTELELLFESDAAVEIWNQEPLARLACLTASRTGMRVGEILGLMTDSLKIEQGTHWLVVQRSWDRKAIKTTKNGKSRTVPISGELAGMLEVIRPKGGGYFFSHDSGKTPMRYEELRNVYVRAVEAIGITVDEQARRGLGIHSFRFWVNTTLRGKVSDDQVRAIIGHVGKEMTQHYTAHSTETLANTADVLLGVFAKETTDAEA